MERIHQFETIMVQIKTKRVGKPIKGHLAVGFGFSDGTEVFVTTTKLSGLDPILFFEKQIIELIIPSIPIMGRNYLVKVRVGDEYALRTIDQRTHTPVTIESEHPEIGMTWIPHSWNVL